MLARMDGTYDKSADAAYINIVESIAPGEASRQASVEAEGLRAMVVLDFDADDRLLGIEIIGARRVLRPETLAALRRL
jgi:uncharacterized protein YuzE